MKLKNCTVLYFGAMLVSGTAAADALVDVYTGVTIGVGAYTVFANDHDKTRSAQSFGGLVGVDMPFIRIDAE